MARPRRHSNVSMDSVPAATEQELGSMYDYLAKIILLGPSGSGKSCLLHRFVKNEWRILSSQTIGVEFASRIIKVGSGARRKRMKLQLWDTAGTERFRSVSRSYYRGAAGALLVYDVSSHASFAALPTFLHDARALASPQLTLLLAGNKTDLAEGQAPPTPFLNPISSPSNAPSIVSRRSSIATHTSTQDPPQTPLSQRQPPGLGNRNTATFAPDGREVTSEQAAQWATRNDIATTVEVSALNGDGVEELFARLAQNILTKIELGEINPDDPQSGIQYGDGGKWDDGGSVKSGVSDGFFGVRKRKRGRARGNTGGWVMREWEEAFRLESGVRGRRKGCC